MLTQYFMDQAWDDELVIVSPDAGRVKVARNFARKVGVHWAVMEKERPAQQVAEIGYVVGDVRGQDRGPRRRHDRHRRHPLRGREDGARRGRRAGDRLRHPRRLLRPRLRAARLRELGDRADRRHRHDPAAPRRARTTSPCSRPRRRSPTRSAASSPTTRSPRSSPARTSSSELIRSGRCSSSPAACKAAAAAVTESALRAIRRRAMRPRRRQRWSRRGESLSGEEELGLATAWSRLIALAAALRAERVPCRVGDRGRPVRLHRARVEPRGRPAADPSAIVVANLDGDADQDLAVAGQPRRARSTILEQRRYRQLLRAGDQPRARSAPPRARSPPPTSTATPTWTSRSPRADNNTRQRHHPPQQGQRGLHRSRRRAPRTAGLAPAAIAGRPTSTATPNIDLAVANGQSANVTILRNSGIGQLRRARHRAR